MHLDILAAYLCLVPPVPDDCDQLVVEYVVAPVAEEVLPALI